MISLRLSAKNYVRGLYLYSFNRARSQVDLICFKAE